MRVARLPIISGTSRFLQVAFAPAASREFKEATVYYERCRIGLGEAFENEVTAALALIAENPLRWRKIWGRNRRNCLQHFPYYILYRVTRAGVAIMAIAHMRRRPEYWRSRQRKKPAQFNK